MRRTAIKPHRIYELIQEYIASRHQPIDRNKGGRPRTFDDALILTLICIQNLHQFSFRETIEFSQDYFKKLPELLTYLGLTRLAKFKAKSRLETRRTRSTASLKRRF